MTSPTIDLLELSHANRYEAYDGVFEESRYAAETTPSIEIIRDLIREDRQSDGSTPRRYARDIELFLSGDEGSLLPKFLASAVRKYCQMKLELASNQGPRRAWLDIRGFSAVKDDLELTSRRVDNPLTAEALRQALAPVDDGCEGEPNFAHGSRRLIYLESPDGESFRVLMGAALLHELIALRAAITSYIGYRTCFKLSINLGGATFRLSMHLKYPVRVAEDEEAPRHLKLWKDSPTVNSYANGKIRHLPPTVYTARKVIEICGRTYKNYTTWSFGDLLHGAESISEKDAEDFPHAWGRTLDANMPIMDAREYGLAILTGHLALLSNEWTDMEFSHREKFEAHEADLGSLPTADRRLSNHQHAEIVVMYELNQSWESRLRTLRNEMRELLGELDRFMQPSGGIGFISRCLTEQPRESDNLRASENHFEELKSTIRRLENLLEQCQQHSHLLHQRLATEATNQNFNMAAANWFAMQYLPPVLISVGLCSMNEKIMPAVLNNAGLTGLFMTMLIVTVAFISLQYAVAHHGDDSKRWKTIILHMYQRCDDGYNAAYGLASRMRARWRQHNTSTMPSST